MSGDGATLLRVVASLVVVLALAWLAARLARRAGVRGEGLGLRVLDRVGLTRDTAIVVVEVAGRGLVLGTGTQGVTVLAELDAAQLAAARRERRTDGKVSVTRVVASGGASGGGTAGATAQQQARTAVPGQRAATVTQTSSRGTTRSTTQQVQQGTGSVLDPRTWRQGLDALRDLTVRRG